MTKIEALQKTISLLENNFKEYSWGDYDNCNCGIVAKVLLGGKAPRLNGFYLIEPIVGITKSSSDFSARTHCLSTNMPLPKVFQALKDAGFTHADTKHLEYCSDPVVLKRIGTAISYDSKEGVIAYLKAWVEILQEEVGQNVQVSVQVEYPDLTQSLAVLPIEETSDVVKVKEVVK